MIEVVQRHIIPATFELLPKQASDNAAIMLLAIGLQESRFFDRRQKGNGPARGYWQFERISTLDVFAQESTSKLARDFCAAIGYRMLGLGLQEMVDRIHPLLEHNDILACGMARLKLWVISDPLPLPGEVDAGWRQYRASWRPGKPKPETWPALYSEAVERVRLSHSDTRLA